MGGLKKTTKSTWNDSNENSDCESEDEELMEEYDCYEECNDESDAADETQSESSVAVLDSFSSLKINEDETLKKNTNTKSLETI